MAHHSGQLGKLAARSALSQVKLAYQHSSNLQGCACDCIGLVGLFMSIVYAFDRLLYNIPIQLISDLNEQTYQHRT